MTSLDCPAGDAVPTTEQTGAGRAQDPAATLPRDGRAARDSSPGGPVTPLAPRGGVAGGKRPRSSRERAVAGKPGPGTGADGLPSPAPGRGRAQSPAGGELDADGSPPAGSSGALFLDLQDAERAALGHTRRADARAYLNAHLAGKMTEAELEEEIRDACKKLGIIRFHVRFSIGTTAGLPDDILIGSRGILWRECKTAKGKVTEAQQDAGQALTAAGQDWAVWRPADWFSGRIQAELAAIAGLRAGAA